MTVAQAMPTPVRAIRVLLFVAGGLTLMAALNAWLLTGGGYGLGLALVVAAPGVASLAAGRAVGTRPKRWLWRALIVLEVCYLLWQFSRVGAGDPFGLIGLAFPIALLVLLGRPAARRYFQ
jgi:hypothetical protein